MNKELTFHNKLSKFPDSPLWGFHVMVPTQIATLLIKNNNRRVIIYINEAGPYHQALMPDGKSGFFLTINKEIRSALNLKIDFKLTIRIKKDLSKYGMHMPIELAELLKLDIEGSAVFHSLTLGKQRSLIHLVSKNKRSETRITKSIVILDYLREVNGKLDYKELNQAFKTYNSH